MKTISQIVREKKVEELVNLVSSGSINKSWLVQGMPSGGVDQVFKKLSQQIENLSKNQEYVKVINIDFASLWTKPLIVSLAPYFIEPLPLTGSFSDDESKDISSLLTFLRTSIKHLSEKGWQIIYIFNHFDNVLKFSNLEEVQELLNTFQSLCYENKYRTTNIVECYRDIEDICKHTNYSDYYKIFGANHSRIGRVSSVTLEQELRKIYPEINKKAADAAVSLSGGYPELIDVLLREINIEDQASVNLLRSNMVFLSSFPFDTWIDCLTPNELVVLELISTKRVLGKEHLFHTRKLLRKELLIENPRGEFEFISPLFEHFLMDRQPIDNSANRVVIKRRGLLDSLHREIIEELFSDRFIIEINLQQEPLPGNAYVFKVTGEDEKGVMYRPCIVKIDDAKRAERENNNLKIAREMLGTIVPSIVKRKHLRGQEAVILEYASADNKNYTVQQFAEYYQERNPVEIAQLLGRVFDNVLAPLYKTLKIVERSAKKLYALPRLHQGEYEILSNIAQKSRYFHSGKLEVPGVDNHLQNPGEYLKPSSGSSTPEANYWKFFLSDRPVVDGIGNLHIIDFAELKQESARFLDFVRLESEIKYKLTNVDQDSIDMFVALEAMIEDAFDITQIERISKLPLTNDAQKLALSIFTIRTKALHLCSAEFNYSDFALEYSIGLLTQTLRLALFQDYITEVQQEFAIISAALLINKVETLLSTKEK